MPVNATAILHCRVPVDLAEALDAEARRAGRTKTEIVVAGLKTVLAKGADTMPATKIHWTELELSDTDLNEIAPESETGLAYLGEFRREGAMHTVTFGRIGARHEDPDDISTWGPQSPEDVDWTGFPTE